MCLQYISEYGENQGQKIFIPFCLAIHNIMPTFASTNATTNYETDKYSINNGYHRHADADGVLKRFREYGNKR